VPHKYGCANDAEDNAAQAQHQRDDNRTLESDVQPHSRQRERSFHHADAVDGNRQQRCEHGRGADHRAFGHDAIRVDRYEQEVDRDNGESLKNERNGKRVEELAFFRENEPRVVHQRLELGDSGKLLEQTPYHCNAGEPWKHCRENQGADEKRDQ
jgi:hypothetical protein